MTTIPTIAAPPALTARDLGLLRQVRHLLDEEAHHLPTLTEREALAYARELRALLRRFEGAEQS